MNKDVMIVTGAGQISMAIARRMGYGRKIVMGDKNIQNVEAIAQIMNNAGYDVEPVQMDLSSRESIKELIAKAESYGAVKMLVNGAVCRMGKTRSKNQCNCTGNHSYTTYC